MNEKTVADAIFKVANALYELAEAFEPAGISAPSPVEELPPLEEAPQGSEAVCPKHRVAYREGKYGPFCSRRSEDPAWSKNGFCSITPKNAAVWLRAQAAA